MSKKFYDSTLKATDYALCQHKSSEWPGNGTGNNFTTAVNISFDERGGILVQRKFMTNRINKSTTATAGTRVASGIYLDFTPKYDDSLITVRLIGCWGSGGSGYGPTGHLRKDGARMSGTRSSQSGVHAFKHYNPVKSDDYSPFIVQSMERSGSTSTRRYEFYFSRYNKGTSYIRGNYCRHSMEVMEYKYI